jgi:integrative and conjugative element protein (TIGR02256 family)
VADLRATAARSMRATVPLAVAWVRASALSDMIAEADKWSPRETGGILIGYWSNRFSDVVVTNIIGPGPRAVHCKTSFQPDHDYQDIEVARLYLLSGRVHTYIGDWHTHPGATPEMSRADRRTLARIAQSPGARAPVPIMGILGGDKSWRLAVWKTGGTRWVVQRPERLEVRIVE